MKDNNPLNHLLKTGILLITLIIPLLFSLDPFLTTAQETEEVFKGKITSVLVEEENEAGCFYQELEVELENQENVRVINDPQASAKNIRYKEGEKVLVQRLPVQGEDAYVITSHYRVPYLRFIFLVFIVLAVLIGRKRGLFSIIGMAFSFFVIFKFILPQISGGSNPLLITLAASIFMIPVTFYLSHGFNRKTHIAIVSTLIILTVTILITTFSISAAKLTGYASEESRFLQIANQNINMRGILLAGIIIGFLGVLDDVTVSQSSIVMQLKKSNKNLGSLDLYKQGMEVGRDHITSMINTLVLVYAGASMPLLLLFINNPQPFAQIINREIIADEIIRTVLGSIGLILAVPLSTFLASLVADAE